MTTINAYLTFDGNCREAMEFYKKCIGGKLTIQTIGESPLAGSMPKKMKDCILHATLTNGNILLLASDMVNDSGLKRGNGVSLMMNCNSEKDIRKYYEKLADGGIRTHQIEKTYWGALLGDLTDKYGNNWILYYPSIQK